VIGVVRVVYEVEVIEDEPTIKMLSIKRQGIKKDSSSRR
jgi:hypothetical protein